MHTMTATIGRLRALLLDEGWSEDHRADALRTLAEIEAAWDALLAPDVEAALGALLGAMRGVPPSCAADVADVLRPLVEDRARLAREVERLTGCSERSETALRHAHADVAQFVAKLASRITELAAARGEIESLTAKVTEHRAALDAVADLGRGYAVARDRAVAAVASGTAAPGEAWERLREAARGACVEVKRQRCEAMPFDRLEAALAAVEPRVDAVTADPSAPRILALRRSLTGLRGFVGAVGQMVIDDALVTDNAAANELPGASTITGDCHPSPDAWGEILWAAEQLRPYGATDRVDFGGVGQAIRTILTAVDGAGEPAVPRAPCSEIGFELGEVDHHGELEIRMSLDEKSGSAWLSDEMWRRMGEVAGWSVPAETAAQSTVESIASPPEQTAPLEVTDAELAEVVREYAWCSGQDRGVWRTDPRAIAYRLARAEQARRAAKRTADVPNVPWTYEAAARRGALIDRDLNGPLTDGERAELAALEDRASAWMRSITAEERRAQDGLPRCPDLYVGPAGCSACGNASGQRHAWRCEGTVEPLLTPAETREAIASAPGQIGPRSKPFPMPGTVWRFLGNEQAPPSGPHTVTGLRWSIGRVEALFGADSCAGVEHMMGLDAWACEGVALRALTEAEARAITPITHVEVNGALRAIHVQAEKVDGLARQRREAHGAGVMSARQAGRAEGLREAAGILSRCHDVEAERYRGDVPPEARPTVPGCDGGHPGCGVCDALDETAGVEEVDPSAAKIAAVPSPACNVDHTTDERPRVLGGECADCLHRPPLHEPTCTKARCSHPPRAWTEEQIRAAWYRCIARRGELLSWERIRAALRDEAV